MKHRLPAIDWMRGIAMVLMASDHAGEAFNAGRLVTDSIFLYDPGVELGALQFANRWISHICAPTFLFLAGTSLALSIERKKQRGVSSSRIDRDLLIRGLIILGFDLFIINWFWFPGLFILQVMYAIGLAMILMIPLRRLPASLLICCALAILLFSELFLNAQFFVSFEPSAVANTFLMSFGVIDAPIEGIAFFARTRLPDKISVGYPLLPWWAMMALGWAFGRYLLKNAGNAASRLNPVKLMSILGLAGITVFAVLRGINAYGNMQLLRLDNSWIQWLHVSKYPPGITFTALQLGLMALILAGLLRWQGTPGRRIRDRNPLLVFGQTAFFFYIVHILLFETAARALGIHHQGGLMASTIATILGVTALYPLCLWYRRYKAGHPGSFARFI